MTLKTQLISDCAGAIYAGVSIEVYQQRASRAVDLCSVAICSPLSRTSAQCGDMYVAPVECELASQ